MVSVVGLEYRNNNFINDLLSNLFLISACVFLPLQVLSFSISSSRFDLTIFFVIGFILVKIFEVKISISKLLILIILLLIYCANSFYLGFSQPARFTSAFIWISFLVIIIALQSKFNIDKKIAFYSIVIPLIILAIYTIFEFAIFGIYRPKSTFDEPSYAGLCFYSASFGFIARYRYGDLKDTRILFFALILFLAGFCTKSMHLLTFIISSGLLFFFQNKITKIKEILLLMVLLIILISTIIIDSHYSKRLNIFSPTDVSLLSWLRGLDQAFYVIKNFPLFGTGLGSTGEFEFYSDTNVSLKYYKLETLNLTDAYSMFFRLTIEMGIVGISFFLYMLISKYKEFLKVINKNKSDEIFCFYFSLALIIGILIKEPTYSRSYLFLAILLYFNPFNDNEKIRC